MVKTIAPCVLLHAFILILFVVDGWSAFPKQHYTSRPLRITTVLIEPYMMLNPVMPNRTGNAQYYGYIAELLEKLSNVVGFSYTIHQVPDGNFGYRKQDGSWDGMVGELERMESDIAAAPMFATKNRARVVDFTSSYLNVHATLLIRKPPHGTESKIKSVKDLINQSEVQYGTLDTGVLIRAFRRTNETLYKMMWRNILRFEPTAFTKSNDEGIRRIRNSKYAYILPHTIGEYVSLQYPCDLMTLDRFLIDKHYAFAVAKNIAILPDLNRALNRLRRDGYLDRLYYKWWHARGDCRNIQSSKIYSSNRSFHTLPCGNLLFFTTLIVHCIYSFSL